MSPLKSALKSPSLKERLGLKLKIAIDVSKARANAVQPEELDHAKIPNPPKIRNGFKTQTLDNDEINKLIPITHVDT